MHLDKLAVLLREEDSALEANDKESLNAGLQEVFMLKDRMKGYIVVEYKKVLLTKLIISCLIVITGFALAYAIKDMVKPAGAAYSVAGEYPAADMKPEAKDIKPVILRWMRSNSDMPEQILSGIYDAAVENLNPDLILAVCFVESNFNPYGKSRKGAVGLMGIVPDVWLNELKTRGFVQDKRDLYLISNNIASGAYVLQKYLSRTKNLEQALSDYVGGDPDYASKVLQTLGDIYRVKSSSATEQ